MDISEHLMRVSFNVMLVVCHRSMQTLRQAQIVHWQMNLNAHLKERAKSVHAVSDEAAPASLMLHGAVHVWWIEKAQSHRSDGVEYRVVSYFLVAYPASTRTAMCLTVMNCCFSLKPQEMAWAQRRWYASKAPAVLFVLPVMEHDPPGTRTGAETAWRIRPSPGIEVWTVV